MSSDELYVNLVLLSFLIVSFLLNLKFNQINKILNDELRLQRIIVKQHEAKQMKEPFYQLDEKQQNILNDMKTTFNDGEAVEIIFEMVFEEYEDILNTSKLIQVIQKFTKWAIEQEKLEEEK